MKPAKIINIDSARRRMLRREAQKAKIRNRRVIRMITAAKAAVGQ